MQILRARHVGYLTAGQLPTVTELPDVGCTDSLPQYLAGRHVNYYGPLGQLAFAWTCCEALDGQYVTASCFPYGPGPGITRSVALAVTDVSACWSGRANRKVILCYGTDNKWHGSIPLRGGTLNFTWECLPDLNPDPLLGPRPTFRLSWQGCLRNGIYDSGSDTQVPSCYDPLIISYPMHLFPRCCDCNDGSYTGPITDSPAALSFGIVANCRKIRVGRHVYYGLNTPGSNPPPNTCVGPCGDPCTALPPGTGTLTGATPVVAINLKCRWDQVDCYQCENMTCPLVAELTGSGGTNCPLAGVGGLNFVSGGWTAAIAGATVSVVCINVPHGCEGRNPAPRVTLAVTITCGVTNTGTATITIPAKRLEDLDVTLNVPMTDPDPNPGTCCVGSVSVRLMRF